MTNKERQAKLQYLLNSLSMTKEQRDIVVDLVNSSGGSATAKDVINIKMNNDTGELVVFRNDVEIASFDNKGSYDEQSNTTLYKSNEMFNFFNNLFDNDFAMVSDITYSDGDARIVFNVITKQKSVTAIAFVFINAMGAISIIGFQKEQ